MTNKNNIEDDDLLDLEKDFNIKESEFRHLIKSNEAANVKILKHNLKSLDDAIEKIEDGFLDIIYTLDQIMERYEEGKIFKSECSEALEKLLVIAEFSKKMEQEFNNLKYAREEI